MDRIGSNSHLNPSQLYQQNQANRTTAQPKNQVGNVSTQSVSPIADSQKSGAFSDVFGDDELAKLQGNLEAIANLAERALKRIES